MIKNTVLVLSGKGGVGKSTVSANLAAMLARTGRKTGLSDIDLHGPSIPALFGIEKENLTGSENIINPYIYNQNLKIVSMGLLLEDKDSPVVWRGPMKAGFIKRFMQDTQWGDLDYLIVDCPPGTGDELLSVIGDSENLKGVIIVTTPQKLAVIDARKAIRFCKEIKLPVLGVVENMSGFVCEKCGEINQPFLTGGGELLAKEENAPYLGSIPLDRKVIESAEQGKPFVELYADSAASENFAKIFEKF
jgi:Mrp family chromosome partitioning ATPase